MTHVRDRGRSPASAATTQRSTASTIPESYVFKSKRGLSAEVVEEISAHKNEPDWMRKFRLQVARVLPVAPDAGLGRRPLRHRLREHLLLPQADREAGQVLGGPPARHQEHLGPARHPEAERKFLAGVGAQYESEVVYHKLQEELEKQGVIFLDMDSGLREHPDLVKQYFGTIIPQNDNKFAALNSAVWSGGSFIYVPPGVKIEMPLQAYFRINAENMGQFERTLIIVDEGAYVHYVEGCTAPIYSTDSLHSAVVEIIVKKGGRCRYTTIQNWSTNVYNLVTKRAVAYEDATMEWVDGNLGSKVTMKYPAIWLMGEGAHGEVLSIAFAGKGQHQDAGGKCVHVAPNTSSVITSKSISKDGGRAGYRGLLEVAQGRGGSKSKVVCDALILDEESRSRHLPVHPGRRERGRLHRARGDRLEDRRGAALLPDEPRALRGRGERDDRLRLRRADHEGASARVRGRDEPADPAADGGVGRLIEVVTSKKGDRGGNRVSPTHEGSSVDRGRANGLRLRSGDGSRAIDAVLRGDARPAGGSVAVPGRSSSSARSSLYLVDPKNVGREFTAPHPATSRCAWPTWPRPEPRWSMQASSSRATSSTPASATWPSSTTPTATR